MSATTNTATQSAADAFSAVAAEAKTAQAPMSWVNAAASVGVGITFGLVIAATSLYLLDYVGILEKK